MIWKPYRGQQVVLKYSAKWQGAGATRHDHRGEVIVAARGPGPQNALVRIGDEVVVVPRGHLCDLQELRKEKRRKPQLSLFGEVWED